MLAVAITRDEHTAAELRREAARCRDSDAARRMLALALVKEGWPRAEAAQCCGVEPRGSPDMDRQTLRDWVHRYNAAGLAGLSDKQGRPGPKPRLSAEQEAEVAGLVREGPDLAEDGIVRWRRADLARMVAERFGVSLAERTVGSLLRRLGFAHVSARPCHPNAAAQASFRPRSAPS